MSREHVSVRESHPFTVELVSPPQGGDFMDMVVASIGKKSWNKAWCEGCSAYVNQTHTTVVTRPPHCLNLNAGNGEVMLVNEDGASEKKYTNVLERLDFVFDESKGLIRADERSQNVVSYELTGVVVEICHDEDTSPHLVAIIKKEDEWICFNDFLVQPIDRSEALTMSHWKVNSQSFRC